jgi:hypothetical protein
MFLSSVVGVAMEYTMPITSANSIDCTTDKQSLSETVVIFGDVSRLEVELL